MQEYRWTNTLFDSGDEVVFNRNVATMKGIISQSRLPDQATGTIIQRVEVGWGPAYTVMWDVPARDTLKEYGFCDHELLPKIYKDNEAALVLLKE